MVPSAAPKWENNANNGTKPLENGAVSGTTKISQKNRAGKMVLSAAPKRKNSVNSGTKPHENGAVSGTMLRNGEFAMREENFISKKIEI